MFMAASKRISTAKLRKRKKSAHAIDAILNPANDEVNPAAWMVRMSEYRNIITHRAPLTYLGGGSTRIEIRFQPWMEGKTLPRILAMIPADPFNSDNGAMVDALILFHSYSANLLHFAAECARYRPIASAAAVRPQQYHLVEGDRLRRGHGDKSASLEPGPAASLCRDFAKAHKNMWLAPNQTSARRSAIVSCRLP